MKAVVFDSPGGAEVLNLVDVDDPAPGAGEVLIRVTSCGLNRADTIFRQGNYLRKPRFPSRIGMEAAGIVEAVPDGSPFKPGDRVAVIPGATDASAQGGCAEKMLAPARILLRTPASVSDADAGGVWMQYLTAWGALNYVVKTTPGQFVVVTAASSSVGLAAVQIVNALGATSIATTTSKDKIPAIKANGATHVINLRAENYVERVKAITGGMGVDTVFDPVAGPFVADHIRACRSMGTIFIYGVLDSSPMTVNPGQLLGKNINLRGYTLYPLVTDPPAVMEAVKTITENLDSGKFKLVIARRFPLAEVRAAHRHMESNQHVGKIVINP